MWKSFACLCFLLLIIGAQKSFGGSSVKTAKIVAVAQSKLAFTKPGQTGNLDLLIHACIH